MKSHSITNILPGSSYIWPYDATFVCPECKSASMFTIMDKKKVLSHSLKKIGKYIYQCENCKSIIKECVLCGKFLGDNLSCDEKVIKNIIG